MKKKYQLFINNSWCEPASSEWFETVNPFDGQPWADIPRGSAEDVDRAVRAASDALSGPWGELSATRRGALMHRLGELIERDAETLAKVEARDSGKLLAEVKTQILYLSKYFYYFGGLADKIQGAVIPIDRPGVFNYTKLEPMGVVAAITPWNASLTLTVWKLAPALCGGNTFVSKPSEYTSASLLEFARLFVEAGFPPGVFNVVTGFAAEVGEPLVRHPKVDRVAFTGGDAGGRAVARAAADTLKHFSLELGGKSPNIVFDDADMDRAVKGAVSGIFSAAGQFCVAGSRLLLQDNIHDTFVEKLVALTRTARAGDPSDPSVQIGPIANERQFSSILGHIEMARGEGARCITGGKALSGAGYGAGQIIEPTIFVDVTNDMRIAQEEVFGPVLSVIRFKDEEDAIRIANDVRFGLAAGVWTQSLKRAMLMAERIRAGTIWINNYRSTSFMTPFGGFKDSGIGREGGVDAVREYLQVKSVWISSDLEMDHPFVKAY